MFGKEISVSNSAMHDPEEGCCSCFVFLRKPQGSPRTGNRSHGHPSQELLIRKNTEYGDGSLYDDDASNSHRSGGGGYCGYDKEYEAMALFRALRGITCREIPVKETRHFIRGEDENGNKMINEYVRECKIGSGSYAKVVLYRSNNDGKRYAIKAFHKSHLSRIQVAPSETAMTDVLREVSIMKMLEHPNIVNLIEVIDDPDADHFFMVLEYVEGKWACIGSGPSGGIGENLARRYLCDIVAGLIYLHAHSIVHGDIKPDNLLVTSSGMVKIGDFSVSQVIKDDNDELRRSPGTPVFTAPECCSGITYHGKAADVWALGVTLYCMVLGSYPFLGSTLQDTYEKIVNNPLHIPAEINPQLKNLLQQLLSKDPKKRITLDAVAEHPWVVLEGGPVPRYSCWCKRICGKSRQAENAFV